MTIDPKDLMALCDRDIAAIEADVAKVKRGERLTPPDPWERGYAKGYARALSQLVELVEARSHSYAVDDLVRDLADKLRQQAMHES